MNCALCRYAHPVPVYPLLMECRRHAPQSNPNQVDVPNAVWPYVSNADWCGEWAFMLPVSETPPTSAEQEAAR